MTPSEPTGVAPATLIAVVAALLTGTAVGTTTYLTWTRLRHLPEVVQVVPHDIKEPWWRDRPVPPRPEDLRTPHPAGTDCPEPDIRTARLGDPLSLRPLGS